MGGAHGRGRCARPYQPDRRGHWYEGAQGRAGDGQDLDLAGKGRPCRRRGADGACQACRGRHRGHPRKRSLRTAGGMVAGGTRRRGPGRGWAEGTAEGGRARGEGREQGRGSDTHRGYRSDEPGDGGGDGRGACEHCGAGRVCGRGGHGGLRRGGARRAGRRRSPEHGHGGGGTYGGHRGSQGSGEDRGRWAEEDWHDGGAGAAAGMVDEAAPGLRAVKDRDPAAVVRHRAAEAAGEGANQERDHRRGGAHSPRPAEAAERAGGVRHRGIAQGRGCAGKQGGKDGGLAIRVHDPQGGRGGGRRRLRARQERRAASRVRQGRERDDDHGRGDGRDTPSPWRFAGAGA